MQSKTDGAGQEGQEAQVAHVRDSLLQHIQCVQREITRLQARQKRNQQSQLPPQSAQAAVERPDQTRLSGQQEVLATVRLQRWWRSRLQNASQPPAGTKSGQTRPSLLLAGPFRAVHHAAARIQRCWRINRWRRRFVDVSVKQVGWLGSLVWLQEQNLLYGTELADAEDARWWMEQRADAPLDHQVDPWGAMKLRDHLDRMWYGRSSEELLQEKQAQQQQLLLQQQRLMQQRQQSKLLNRQEKSDGLQGRYSLSVQDMWQGDGKKLGSQGLRGRSSMHGLGIAASGSSNVSPDRSAARRVQRGLSATLPGKSASLSPRRELRGARGELSSRAQVPGIQPVRSFLSPQSTHRALGNSSGSVSQTSLQPQSPLSTSRQLAYASQAAVAGMSSSTGNVGRVNVTAAANTARPQQSSLQAPAVSLRHQSPTAAAAAAHGAYMIGALQRAPLGAHVARR